MPSEGVEIARRGYEAYEARGIEGILEFLDPEIEWRNPTDLLSIKADSGFSSKALLRQPGGFEGFGSVGEAFKPRCLAITKRP